MQKAVMYSFSAIRENSNIDTWHLDCLISQLLYFSLFYFKALLICMKHTIVIKNNIQFRNRMWSSGRRVQRQKKYKNFPW